VNTIMPETDAMKPGLVAYMLVFALLLALVACAAPAPTAPTAPSPQPVPVDALVIQNGRVIAATGEPPIPDGMVVIQGDRILAVGRAAQFSLPPQANVVDAKGGTIMPGIINAHVHSTSNSAVRRVYFLLKGVTAVCDLGSELDKMPEFEQDSSSGLSARGFRAGPIVTAPGGYPGVFWGFELNYEVANPGEAREAVADLVKRGADVIKIALEPGSVQDPWPMLTLEEVQVIVQEAHARGKLVRAHVGRTEGTRVLDIVLESGVDVIEHVPLPLFSIMDAYNLLQDRDRYTLTREQEAQLDRLAAQGVIMVPTLDYPMLWCESAKLTPGVKQACLDFYLEPVRRFHSMGGMVALGNDYGADPVIERGMPLREMQLLLAAGLTPMEVIQAGTRHAAYVCGHSDELGTLEPGKLADVIVVDGDPLVEMEAMGRVTVVIKGGQVAYSSE
jgi:imidazolonepropionase-like amidohydrolase